MASRFPVPERPKTSAQDYAFDQTWMGDFYQDQANARNEIEGLRGQGDSMARRAQQVQGRAGPETNFTGSQATTGQQIGAADWLSDFAQGPQGPSAAQAQLANATNQGMAQNNALARAGSGFGESAGNIAAAQRQNSTMATNAANNSAMLRATEDASNRDRSVAAMGQAAGIYGGAAGLQSGQSQFRTQAEMEAQAQRDALQLGMTGQSIDAQNAAFAAENARQQTGVDVQGQNLQGRIARGQTEADLYGTEADVFDTRLRRDAQQREARRSDRGEATEMISKGAAAIASVFSDERGKKNKRAADLRERYRDLGD